MEHETRLCGLISATSPGAMGSFKKPCIYHVGGPRIPVDVGFWLHPTHSLWAELLDHRRHQAIKGPLLYFCSPHILKLSICVFRRYF